MKPLIELINVSKIYKENCGVVKAVNDVNLKLYEDDSLGIVGESGSGKSTVSKIIIRLISSIDDGKVLYFGKDIYNFKNKELKSFYKDVKIVFQNPLSSFNPRMRLEASVIEGMINSGIPKNKALISMKEIFKTCGLKENIAKCYPHEVSGGECQRAAIAAAVLQNPKLIIFDEVTSALDAMAQKNMLELITKLKEEKKLSLIFISHDITLVQSICNKIAVMKNGKIVEKGTTKEVVNSPKNDYTKLLLDAVITIK